MDLKGSIPIFIRLTEASIHDSKVMDEIPVVTNAYYLMDKGYVKFDSLYKHFHQNHAWFVTRAKDNMLYIVTESREVDTQTGLISDETIQLTGLYTSLNYSGSLKPIVYEDFRDEKSIDSSLINSRLMQSLLQNCIEKDGRLRSSSSGLSSTCTSRPFTVQPAMLSTRRYG